jgi:osmotically-inducible protein OsmY
VTNHQIQGSVNGVRLDGIGVRIVNGTVVLTGTVASWAERDSAVAAAWAVPGVVDVDDRLELFYY